MEDSNYIKVFTGSFLIIQLIVEQLDAVGINAIVKDESESGRLAGFGASIQGQQELYINKEEEETAVKIIEAVTSNLDA
ncbi:putative signal transducing protein [Formosa sp. PL04]|uniref:putative signal transducing protein n=1 Tax=Formosa sp. PL04 TaxID=3081755 RepID=UPI002982705F|nr:DUF2007 domain-containing protein [Formosa sp. PL04]MDW5289751.1 DUF2007 domain-containing protein [Formosa sp. PL04]